MCMLFLFMIYYKCIFIRFHEDKYSMDFFKKKNIKKLKIINNPRLFTAIPCEVAEIHVITVF